MTFNCVMRNYCALRISISAEFPTNRAHQRYKDGMSLTRVRMIVPAAILVAVGLVAGCSATTVAATPSAPAMSASPSPAPFCASFNQLKASVGDLRNVNPISGGMASVTSAIGTIQTNLNDFQAAASTQFGSQVTQFKASLSSVQSAAQAATSTPSASTIASVVASIAGVVSSYNALQSAVANRCD